MPATRNNEKPRRVKRRTVKAVSGWKPKGTEASRQLCEIVSNQSGGCCLFSFSRGKDSIAAYVWLREFFDRIIPFNTVIAPNMGFVHRSLKYYEKILGCEIETFIHSASMWGFSLMEYQPIEDEDAIFDDVGPWQYYNEQLADLVAEKHNLGPEVLTAFGISQADNIWRRQRLVSGDYDYTMGLAKAESNFYPTFDWTKDMIVEAIEKSGIKLPGDYLLNQQTFNINSDVRALEPMMALYPEDFEKIELMFPLLRAAIARNVFRRRHFGRRCNHLDDEVVVLP